jgi:LmbE family N-acetylglucosaminyl deacetylase
MLTQGPVILAERPERLLVIVAHPDDAELGVAGSVARWVREGSTAHLVCCTSGDAGGDGIGGDGRGGDGGGGDPVFRDDADADPLELAATREREQRAAAAIVGYEAVTFLHRPDGALANDLALREQLVRIIRTFRPDTVASSDPRVIVLERGLGGPERGRGGLEMSRGVLERGLIAHTDHRAAGAAAVDAVYPAAENAMAFPHLARSEGLAPHRVSRLLLFWAERPTACVDISSTLQTKVEALHAHASQLRHPERLGERVWDAARSEGAACGLEAAESWTVIDR